MRQSQMDCGTRTRCILYLVALSVLILLGCFACSNQNSNQANNQNGVQNTSRKGGPAPTPCGPGCRCGCQTNPDGSCPCGCQCPGSTDQPIVITGGSLRLESPLFNHEFNEYIKLTPDNDLKHPEAASAGLRVIHVRIGRLPRKADPDVDKPEDFDDYKEYPFENINNQVTVTVVYGNPPSNNNISVSTETEDKVLVIHSDIPFSQYTKIGGPNHFREMVLQSTPPRVTNIQLHSVVAIQTPNGSFNTIDHLVGDDGKCKVKFSYSSLPLP